jgi:hypothetical protein
MATTGDPIKSLPKADPGAETSNRYRYQAAYAGLVAVTAMEQVPDAVAVYCEHHEDILLEFQDGLCDAIQVKSQADSSAPLKGNGDVVLKSLRRFVELEAEFGARIRRYRLASISGFYKVGKSSSNVGHCLEQAQGCAPTASPEPPLSTLIKKMNVADSTSPAVVLSSLKKVFLDPTLPKLRDIDGRVRQGIERLDGMGNYRASDLQEAAQSIIAMADEAGRATDGTSAEDYFAYLDDPEAHAAKALIAAKRLGLAEIRDAIHEAVKDAALLRSTEGADITQLPSSSGIAERKLDAGGMPIHVVELLGDLRSSAEFEVQRRLYRNGKAQANAQYDHAQLLIQAIAEDARQAVRQDGTEEYGQAMWADLRQRLDQLRIKDATSLVGFTPEQLTGVAMILTDLCKVWWSEPFDLNADQ